MDIIPPGRQPQAARPSQPQPSGQSLPEPADNTPRSYTEPPRNSHNWRGILSTIGLFVSAFIIAILLNTFVIQSYQVDGESMEPTLQNNDRLIVNKVPRSISRVDGHQYVPQRGDIIIFNEDGLPGFVGTKQLIKRVIGLPGERVVVANGKITIYNQQHPNGFNPDTSDGYHIAAPTTVGNVDLTLQNNQLFVCGDNRGNSEDSRYFGPINTNQVVAKLMFRILPLDKAKAF